MDFKVGDKVEFSLRWSSETFVGEIKEIYQNKAVVETDAVEWKTIRLELSSLTKLYV